MKIFGIHHKSIFRPNYKIMTVFNIPIRLHSTFILYLLAVFCTRFFKAGFVDATKYVVFFLTLFVCVTLHELGHCFAARKLGIKTKSILLTPIGGIASIEKFPNNYWHQIFIAVAGPTVTLALIVIAFFTYKLVPLGLFKTVCMINIVLFVFNALPNYPMDGGRVYKALLAMKFGELKAVRWAMYLNYAFLLLFTFVSVKLSSYNLLIIGLFMTYAGAREYRSEKLKTKLTDIERRFKSADSVYDVYELHKEIQNDKSLTPLQKCRVTSMFIGLKDAPCIYQICDRRKFCDKYDKMHNMLLLMSMEQAMNMMKHAANMPPRQRNEAVIWVDGKPQRCKVQETRAK